MCLCVKIHPMLDLDTVERYFNYAPRRRGKYYMTFCPCHHDQKPSLGIKVRDDNSLKFRCFAGCDSKDVELAFAGGKVDLVTYNRVKVYKDTPPWKKTIQAVYPYTDQYGNELYQKVRFVPKDFAMRRRVESRWRWSVPPALFTLYNLPSVVKAQTVFIVEGEKGVGALQEWGLVATCSPNGGSKISDEIIMKWQPKYNDWFIGKHVILLPDNDESGYGFMQYISQNLHDCQSVTTIILPRLDAKEDFYDWAKLRNGTIEELRELWTDARTIGSI